MENSLNQNPLGSVNRISRGSMFGSAPTNAPSYKTEIKSGDSLWKIIENLLQNFLGFKSLGEIEKINALGNIVNKIMTEPLKYGLDQNGLLKIGQKLDLTSMFDEEKLKIIFDKASKLTEEQKIALIENNKRISNWVSANSGKAISGDTVSEILSFSLSKPVSNPIIIDEPTEKFKSFHTVFPIQTPVKPLSVMPLSTPATSILKPPITIPKQPPTSAATNMHIEELKKNNSNINQTPGSAPVYRSMAGDSSMNQAIEAAFQREIDIIYGKKGILGMGATSGLESKDWIFIRKLPAGAVLQYFTGDSGQTAFPHEVADELARTENHHTLIKQIIGLMNETKGEVKPYPQESLEEFFKRLGAFVMKKVMVIKSS